MSRNAGKVQAKKGVQAGIVRIGGAIEIPPDIATDDAFEPFFQPKPLAQEIKRGQTVTEQTKWIRYFEQYGCLVCGTRAAIHGSCGMCTTCYARTLRRLNKIVGERGPERKAAVKRAELVKNKPRPDFVDPVELAQRALLPSIEILRRGTGGELSDGARKLLGPAPSLGGENGKRN